MAILSDESLKAADCTKLIISMWFKLPQLPPTPPTPQPPPTTPENFRFEEYILMEFGGYQQVSLRRYYPVQWSLAQTFGYSDILRWASPISEGWFEQSPVGNPGVWLYGYLPGTPLGGTTGQPSHPTLTGAPGEGLPTVVVTHDAEFGTYGVVPGEGHWFPNVFEAWGLNHGFPENHVFGPPLYVTPPAVVSTLNHPSDVYAIQWEDFGVDYYLYNAPSTIWISANQYAGGTRGYQLNVRIGGAVAGPFGARPAPGGGLDLGSLPNVHQLGFNPGSSVAPRLIVRAPDASTIPGAPLPGAAERPWVTPDAWHHVLVCVNLNNDGMTKHGFNDTAIYNDNMTMHVLLDGVPYGGTPWPPNAQEMLGAPVEEGHEAPGTAYSFPPPNSALPYQDRSFDNRNGILVNGLPLHIPYDPRWSRRPADYTNPANPYVKGWKGGDQSLSSVFIGANLGQFDPAPAFQRVPPDDPTTLDIERRYSDVQIWFGKYIDPTDYNNLKLFIDIDRNTDGDLVGNIPALDEEAIAAYEQAKIDDPTTKVLSLAAAPNNLGTPDVYLVGGASSFVHNKGKETEQGGADMVQIGTIENTPKPVDIPIAETAVKPPGL